MAKNQYYGIKYPITINNSKSLLLDVNTSLTDKVKSMLMHIIFTPKGQKIRDQEFGTNLIKFIFEPNDSFSWDSVKSDIETTVNKYMNNITINNISVLNDTEDGSQIYVRIDYSVINGIHTTNDSLVVEI